jgi:hypothetical protein
VSWFHTLEPFHWNLQSAPQPVVVVVLVVELVVVG